MFYNVLCVVRIHEFLEDVLIICVLTLVKFIKDNISKTLNCSSI